MLFNKDGSKAQIAIGGRMRINADGTWAEEYDKYVLWVGAKGKQFFPIDRELAEALMEIGIHGGKPEALPRIFVPLDLPPESP